jgi:HK97 gp10 family phage protein
MARNISLKGKAFKLEGVPDLVKTLKTLGDTFSGEGRGAFDDRVREAMLVPAEMIADEARHMAPSVTGELRKSIIASKLKHSVGAMVWTHGVRYAAWVEFGTSKMSAQPYMRPAINAVRPMAANVIGEQLRKIVEDVAAQTAWHEKDGASKAT